MINQSVLSGGSSNDLNAFSSGTRFLQIIQSIDSSIKVKLKLRNPSIVIPTVGNYKDLKWIVKDQIKLKFEYY